MLTETGRSVASIGEAGERFIDSIQDSLQYAPAHSEVHHIHIGADGRSANSAYEQTAEIIRDSLKTMPDSYIARTVLAFGGTAVVKAGLVPPFERHDDMDWHVDVRQALVMGTAAGTEVLSGGDSLSLLRHPRLAGWHRAVQERQRAILSPTDNDLADKGFKIEPLKTRQWYELGSDTVHRAPHNNSDTFMQRLFIGITPPYYIV